MTRLAYITDSHLGGTKDGWGQQPIFPELVPELFGELCKLLERENVSLLLHGGDWIDSGTAEQIDQAVLFAKRFPCPIRVALGNHDLAAPGALAYWQLQKDVFANATATGDVATDLGDVLLLTVTNTWQNPASSDAFCWSHDVEQLAGLTDAQYTWLEQQLALAPNKPAILMMHETLYPLPTRLTGNDEPIHAPHGPHALAMNAFINAHPQIQLVLSGHCHASCCTHQAQATHLTTAAFFEPPFQVRLLDVQADGVTIRTMCPVDYTRYGIVMNDAAAWSAGQEPDLTLSVPWRR